MVFGFQALLGLKFINFALPVSHLIIVTILYFIYLKYNATLKSKKLVRLSIGQIFLLILMAFSIIVVKDPIINLTKILEIEEFPENVSNDLFDFNYVGFFIYSTLLIPVMEELFFRGMVLEDFLRKRMGVFLSISLSAFLFSLSHLNFMALETSFFFALSNFLFGLVAGAIYYLRRSVMHVIILHLFVNLIAFFIKLYEKSYVDIILHFGYNHFYWLFFVLSFFTLIIGFYFFKTSSDSAPRSR